MISIFGDESSSSSQASYGLVAIADNHLFLLNEIVLEAKALLRGNALEPLHTKLLFHDGPRSRSSFESASRPEVEGICAGLIRKVALLEVRFFFGQVDRAAAPKVIHIPLLSTDREMELLEARMKLELPHLQFFAYCAAATRACDALKNPAIRVFADRNNSVVRWFNEKKQSNRLMELISLDATLPAWPTVTFSGDEEHAGLQVADLLTYYATKQSSDQRFSRGFDAFRHKAEFITYEFAAQVYQPYVPGPGVSVRRVG